ncbi:hypothetical protein EWM60_18690 [Candidatus Erwinia dacicola]|nr:hypothetical protein [Candidatus Erwinia dacicola]
MCQTFDVHRSSTGTGRLQRMNPTANVWSSVARSWRLGTPAGGSAGTRSIAAIVSRDSGVKMGRWLVS